MEENDLVEMIQDAIEMYDEDGKVKRVATFEEEGVLTRNKGVVIKMKDKSEFQISVVKSR